MMNVAEGRKVSKSTVSKRTDVCMACVLTVSTTEYTECQAFYPVVRLGSPHPLTRKRVLLNSFGPRGETASLVGEGVGGPLVLAKKLMILLVL